MIGYGKKADGLRYQIVTSKVASGIVIAAILLSGLSLLANMLVSPYLKFMGKDAVYYSKVANACDLIMRQHPVSSNDTVTLYGDMVRPYTIKLSVHDSTLPRIIRGLYPDMILVSSNGVSIEIPPEHMGGFVVGWGPDDMRTNYWALWSNGDGLEKTVYEERRP
jgi:hypothetical protein